MSGLSPASRDAAVAAMASGEELDVLVIGTDPDAQDPYHDWHRKREIHEAASVDGSVGTLRGDLVHYPYRSLQQQLAKTEKYARMMAEHEFARGKRATLGKLVLAPAWRFWRGFVFRGGFRDGWHGLVYAYVRANYVRQKTIMLWMLGNGQPVADPPNP